MNNGDSFHNGSDNLELQKRNRLGPTEEPASEETPPSEEPASEEMPPSDGACHTPPSVHKTAAPNRKDPSLLPPHERPYVNIYASGGVSYPGGVSAHDAPTPPPTQRNYTNIYAQRVANRSADTEPGHYSNTPVPEGGLPYYEDLEGQDPRSTPITYETSDYADEAAERAHKSKFNMAALLLGIASFAGNIVCLTCLTPITAVLAIIFGCVGRVNGKFEQKGLIGMVLGIVYCGLLLLLGLFIVLVAVIAATDGTGVPIE